MAQHAFWVIVDGQTPTSFRARQREDLLPTLTQLKRTQPNVVLMWFERGRLWGSTEEAREALTVRRKAPDRRPRAWRPGGDHVDPRAKYEISRDQKRARFKARLGQDHRDADNPAPPPVVPKVVTKTKDEAPPPARPPYRPNRPDRPPYRPDRPGRPPYRSDRPDRPPFRPDRPDRSSRPDNRPDRPPFRTDRPGRPPYRPGRTPDRPGGDRPQGDRPFTARSRKPEDRQPPRDRGTPPPAEGRETPKKPMGFGDRPWRPKKPWQPGKPWRPGKPKGGKR